MYDDTNPLRVTRLCKPVRNLNPIQSDSIRPSGHNPPIAKEIRHGHGHGTQEEDTKEIHGRHVEEDARGTLRDLGFILTVAHRMSHTSSAA